MKSYSTESRGLLQLAREASSLARGRSADVSGKVAALVTDLREIERMVAGELERELKGLRILDVGAGQLFLQMTYFGLRGNVVIGIDQDVIAQGCDVRGYLEMLRKNGPKRVAKTLARKALLVDARYRRALAKELKVARVPRLRVVQMDAADMTFADGSFDLVYALAVFQHLPNPAAVLDEMIRVLAPGGALYLDFILYTSSGGSHDVRLLAGRDSGSIPHWAHLRDQFKAMVQPNAYLNRIRLPDWVKLFEQRMPGVRVSLGQPQAFALEQEARSLWQVGELTEYELDELLTNKVTVLWRKPRRLPS